MGKMSKADKRLAEARSYINSVSKLNITSKKKEENPVVVRTPVKSGIHGYGCIQNNLEYLDEKGKIRMFRKGQLLGYHSNGCVSSIDGRYGTPVVKIYI